MNHIILSVQPKWAAMILNGTKTVEIRKSAPKPPFTVWMYVTKATASILFDKEERNYIYDARNCLYAPLPRFTKCNGKVVAKFVVEKIDKIICVYNSYVIAFAMAAGDTEIVARAGGLQYDDIDAYLAKKDGYAWHITSLEIIEPMELKEFQHTFDWFVKNEISNVATAEEWGFYDSIDDGIYRDEYASRYPITRAPQSWQFVIPPSVTK